MLQLSADAFAVCYKTISCELIGGLRLLRTNTCATAVASFCTCSYRDCIDINTLQLDDETGGKTTPAVMERLPLQVRNQVGIAR